jgi:hypothetical protein
MSRKNKILVRSLIPELLKQSEGKMKPCLLQIFFGLAILLSGQNQATKTTICEVVKNRQHFAQTLVRVRAVISGGLIHGVVLVDESCEDVGISFEWDDYENRPINLVKDSNYRQLRAVWPRFIAMRDKGLAVVGTFEGLYQWNASDTSTGNFMLRQVLDIHISDKSESGTK